MMMRIAPSSSSLAHLRNPRCCSNRLASLLSSSSSHGKNASNMFRYQQVMFKSMVAREQNDTNQGKKSKVVPKVVVINTKSTTSWDLGLSTLIPEWRNMFRKESLLTDISAGVTVGCVAVPLSLAIALASGVPAEVGLVTAAVSGVAGGLMGGTTLAVTGPAAAISLLVVGAVQEHGLEALPFITLATGGLQLVSGVTRLGTVAKLVPVSVIAGFTTGVGTLILSGQLPKALGLVAPAGLNPIELISFIGSNLSYINPSAAALALGTSAAMFALPRLHAKMPAALVAVGGATAVTHGLGLDVSLIGSIPSGLAAFSCGLPVLPSLGALPSLSATVMLIYAMTSVESLLSCAALEKMKKTTYRHNPDQELVGQGLANMASGFFMGMPVTSVIARSGLNVRLNAETRLPALVQAGFVFGSVVFFSDSIATIPMPALSGVLITTGLGMLNPTEFKNCYAVQKSDVVPFTATIAGMLTFGLAEGIGIGCLSALALNVKAVATNDKMKVQEGVTSSNNNNTFIGNNFKLPTSEWSNMMMDRLSLGNHTTNLMGHHDLWHAPRLQVVEARGIHTSTLQSSTIQDEQHHIIMDDDDFMVDPNSSFWRLHGPINFISMFAIDDMMRRIQARQAAAAEGTCSGSSIVVDMRDVTALEFTGVEELVNRLLDLGAPVTMVNCNAAVINALEQCDPTQKITRVLSQV